VAVAEWRNSIAPRVRCCTGTINARPGLNVLKNPHPAVYPNGIEGMVSEGEATGSACVRGAIAGPNLTAQEIRP
jgi:hypothetical protein